MMGMEKLELPKLNGYDVTDGINATIHRVIP